MWYNTFRSSYDLVQEAAASAAASYLGCADGALSLLLVFKPGKLQFVCSLTFFRG